MRKLHQTMVSICLLLTIMVTCGFSFGNKTEPQEVKEAILDSNAYLALIVHKVDALANQQIPQAPVVAAEDAWRLMLINRDNPLPQDHTFEKATLSNGYVVDARIVEPLNAMIAAAKADGVSIFVCSAYRTVEYQQGLFQRKINQYKAKGYSEQEAYDIAKTIVAIPGTSEHHTGLAVDISTPQYTTLDEGFGDTVAFAWLKEHCAQYGFIMRYPTGKTEITGIIYEPWHYRYVGVDEAKEMTEQGICLEEYWVDRVQL